MKRTVRKAGAVATSALMLGMAAAGSAYAALPDAPVSDAPDGAVEQAGETVQRVPVVQRDVVEGAFSFDQTSVTPTKVIASTMSKASAHLCGSAFGVPPDGSRVETSLSDWTISVTGDVEHQMSATLAELSEKNSTSLTMGCSCAGNPADGQASVNAEVTGVALKAILDEAMPLETANTITFASADGYEVSLPLRYVMQRYCLLAYDLNGEPLADSMGGMNQVWLGSTSAKYFAKDIVSIEVESRETPPAAPGSDGLGAQGANLPNIGVVAGREV